MTFAAIHWRIVTALVATAEINKTGTWHKRL